MRDVDIVEKKNTQLKKTMNFGVFVYESNKI